MVTDQAESPPKNGPGVPIPQHILDMTDDEISAFVHAHGWVRLYAGAITDQNTSRATHAELTNWLSRSRMTLAMIMDERDRRVAAGTDFAVGEADPESKADDIPYRDRQSQTRRDMWGGEFGGGGKHEPTAAELEAELVDAQDYFTSVMRTIGEVRMEGSRARPWLVDGLIPSGAVTLLSAASKAGKTTLMLAVMRAMEDGTPWCGQAVSPGSVWLFTEEGSRSLTEALDMVGLSDHSRHVVVHISDRGEYAWANMIDAIAAKIVRMQQKLDDWLMNAVDSNDEPIESDEPASPPRMVIVDTFGAWTGLDDYNSYGKVTKLFDALKRLRDRTQVAVVLAHHNRKTYGDNDTSPNQSTLGSTAISAQSDHIISLTKPKASSNIRQIVTEGRFQAALAELTVTFNEDSSTYEVCDPDGLLDGELDPKTLAVLALFEPLPMSPPPLLRMSQILAQKPEGVGGPKVRTIINELVASGRLETNGETANSPKFAYRLKEESDAEEG